MQRDEFVHSSFQASGTSVSLSLIHISYLVRRVSLQRLLQILQVLGTEMSESEIHLIQLHIEGAKDLVSLNLSKNDKLRRLDIFMCHNLQHLARCV